MKWVFGRERQLCRMCVEMSQWKAYVWFDTFIFTVHDAADV